MKCYRPPPAQVEKKERPEEERTAEKKVALHNHTFQPPEVTIPTGSNGTWDYGDALDHKGTPSPTAHRTEYVMRP